MSLYGYARVSTFDQDLGIQCAALKAAGYRVIRAEKASSSSRDGRTELQVLLDFVQPATPWSSPASTGSPGPSRTCRTSCMS